MNILVTYLKPILYLCGRACVDKVWPDVVEEVNTTVGHQILERGVSPEPS